VSVRIEHRGDVGIVWLDRPEVRNAVDRPTAEALAAAVRHLDEDPDVAVGVLSGTGGTFCAGADLHAFDEPSRRSRLERSDRAPMGPTRLALATPFVAAIEGHAVAGGLELALWCDLRVAAEDAVLGVFCRRWGVPLIDGGTVRLPRLIGLGRALDLILTGRDVGAEEARAIGLVSRVVPPGTATAGAIALAAELAALPRTTMLADRTSALAAFDAPLPEALLREHDRGVAAIAAGGMEAGVAAFRAGAGRHGAASPPPAARDDESAPSARPEDPAQ
jgi:enoyl-CoA hydratase